LEKFKDKPKQLREAFCQVLVDKPRQGSPVTFLAEILFLLAYPKIGADISI